MKLIQGLGIQKSGTTILRKVFEAVDAKVMPYEQDSLWGQTPAFSPTGYPVGTLYQSHNGDRGHVLYASDVDADMRVEMTQRLSGPGWVYGKSPYATVRIPFIKELYPDTIFVCNIRNPISNIYSIYKKFNSSSANLENGWWGIKSENWRENLRADKVEQLALQWRDAYAHVKTNLSSVDYILPYHDFCSNPSLYVDEIMSAASGESITTDVSKYPKIGFYDNEYLTGAKVISRNQPDSVVNRSTETIPPFTQQQIDMVKDICWDLYSELLDA